MRILKFLIFSAFLVLVVGGLAALLGREVLLMWGASKVRGSISQLHSISRNQVEYVRQCRQKGGSDLVEAISTLQLRFLNATEYVVEVVCTQFPLDPILVSREQLPPLVQKRAGSSGVIWGYDRSMVGLEVYGRQSDVVVENEEIQTLAPGVITSGISPVSTCEGFGYQCCQAETQTGTGESYSNVNDCPRTCFAACIARPVILSFNSDPFPDATTKVVTAAAGEAVTFSYVASYEGNDKASVTIDFGDGQREPQKQLTGQTSHMYQCTSGSCSYTAKVFVQTAQGVESAQTAVTQIQVQVTN